ncbi:diguanylate cyclase [Adlercreutzia sp. R25]|uniref:GGDEF domain-containing protein n=1 Tax=Adlercreutzia shanghongiae TaxID=3111773 RepID=UPI002DB8C1B1|nr:diguanylate cyclase [Adlercreutzia sp. R25]MEC4272266.1 diguanylate cyclase [Adlercreutzia sp. R25]
MVSWSRLFRKEEKPADSDGVSSYAGAEAAACPSAPATTPGDSPDAPTAGSASATDSSAADVSPARRDFLDQFPGGMFRYKVEGDGPIDHMSSGLARLFGCDDEAQFRALTGGTFKGIVHPDDWEQVSTSIDEQVARSDSDYVRYRIVCADGEVRWVDDWGHLVESADGTRWFHVTLMDATDRVREKEALRRANERLEIITALSNDVLFDIECSTGEAHVYGDFEGRFGRAPEQADFVVHRRCQKPCSLNITSYDLSPLMEQIGENSLVDFETSTPGPDGEPVWYRYQSVVLYDEDGGPVRHVGRLLDTSEAAQRESQFRRKAERDSLTGLYNRAAALDRIETLLASDDRPCTLIAVDVDDFKGVNDTYGHLEGDAVLKELAAFLSQVMRKEDVVARMGGDEFLIFAPGLAAGPATDRVLEHLARGPFATQRATDEAALAEGRRPAHAAPSISIGAACCLTPPMPFEELYAVADSTLYQSKEAGKAQYRLTVIG